MVRASTVFFLVLISLAIPSMAEEKLRIGHFPNITHSQGLVAHQLSTEGKGWFENETGLPVEWYVYNAGPSAMEALFTGSLDVSYVGPNPAINAFARSKGKEIRIVSFAATGGSGLIMRAGKEFPSPIDFKGLKLATPQFGNSQDIAARAWFMSKGLKITNTGGDLSIIPTENPDQLALFGNGQLDGCWTVEPWLSRLEIEKNGKLFFEDKDSLTTLMVVSTKMLAKPDLLQKIIKAHQGLTTWILDNETEAKSLVLKQLKTLTGAEIGATTLDRAWGRIKLSSTIDTGLLEKSIKDATSTGFLKHNIDLGLLVSHEAGK